MFFFKHTIKICIFDSIKSLIIVLIILETDINFLLEMALDKIAYLPFAFIVDQVRKQLT